LHPDTFNLKMDRSIATILALLGPLLIWYGATRTWLSLPLAVKRLVVGVLYKLASFLPFGENDKQRYKTYAGEVFARGLGMRAPQFDVKIDRRILSELGNGENLTGTLYSPVPEGGSKADALVPAPVVLIRTPYTRIAWENQAVIFASRGYHCLIQDTRGRFGSSGEFFPIAHEREDGAYAIRWLREQPFCNGKVATFGISYMGLCALAAIGGAQDLGDKPADVAIPVVACTRIFPVIRPYGSFALELGLRWLYLVMNLLVNHPPWAVGESVALSAVGRVQ
jgi:hypothetical protein